LGWEGDKKRITIFGGETPWKEVVWKSQEEDNVTLVRKFANIIVLGEKIVGNLAQVMYPQDLVQRQDFVLQMLITRVS
jgi:hypothetical protein